MRLSLGQELRLVQKQVLAPRMIQSMEILQLPIMQLEEKIEQEMQAQNITKTKMAQMMDTSRASIDRLLNPTHTSLTLRTLESATLALGKKLHISIG